MNGVIVPLLTTLKEDGRFDEQSQRHLVENLVERGITTFFAFGYSGEYKFLPFDVRMAAMKGVAGIVKELKLASGEDVTLVMGVNGKNIAEVATYSTYVNKLGVDGLVLQPSSVPHSHQDSMRILRNNAPGKPFYLYVNPETAIDGNETLPPTTINAFRIWPEFAGVKVTTNIDSFHDYAGALYNSSRGLYIGSALDMFKIDFTNTADLEEKLPDGVITCPGNIFPEHWLKAWIMREGTLDTLARLHSKFVEYENIWKGLPSGRCDIASAKNHLVRNGIIASDFNYAKKLTSEDRVYLDQQYEYFSMD